jgi:hypothetical protein
MKILEQFIAEIGRVYSDIYRELENTCSLPGIWLYSIPITPYMVGETLRNNI